MKKTMMLVLVCVIALTGVMSLNVFAADIWDGTTVDTSWYNTSGTEFTIDTAAELAGLAQIVNGTADKIGQDSFSGKTVTLGDDIDLADYEWTPIGRDGSAFSGVFNGAGHVISNLNITGNNSDIGLFGFTARGEIYDFTVENASVEGYLDVGVVAGTPYTTKYSNITVRGLIEVDGFAYVGGAFGKNAYADLINIDVIGDDNSYVKAESGIYRTYVGGLIGFIGEGDKVIQDCDVAIDVSGSTCDVGGITGILHYGNKIINCTYEGSIELTAADPENAGEIGGIAGTVLTNGNVATAIENSVANVESAVVTQNDGESADVTETLTAAGAFYDETHKTNGELSVEATVNDREESFSNVAARIGEKGYTSFSAALDAAQAGDTIVLAADVENCDKILVGNGGVSSLTVDLNGHNIGFAANNCFQVYGGELNVIGTGTIYEESPYYSPIMMYGSNEDIADYSVVTIGENVTSKGWSGLFIDQNGDANYGMKANVYGTLVSVLDRTGAAGHGLYVNGNIKNQSNCPVITLDGATIVSDGNGMYLAGYADTTIKDSQISCTEDGSAGIEIRAGVLNIENSEVIGGFGEIDYEPNGNGSTTANAALAIAQHTTTLPINVTVTGGTFNGSAAVYQLNPQNNPPEAIKLVNVILSGGDYNGRIISENLSGFINGGVFTDETIVENGYLADNLKLTSGQDGKFVVVEDDNITESVTVGFEKVDENDETLYNIVVSATDDEVINRLTSAQLAFTFTSENNAVAYELIPYGDVSYSADPTHQDRYMFNFDGQTSPSGSGASVVLAQIKFTGYGKIDFGVDGAAEDYNAVHATTFADNIVTDYILNGSTSGDETKGDLVIGEPINTTINVPKKTLAVNIDFNNSITDNASAYQDMKATISGGDLTTPIVKTFGSEGGDIIALSDNSYSFTEDLTENTAYTVTIEGAGYRTTRYTVTMTGDKTLNFWNNVKDAATVVEVGNDSSMATVNYLAGDIVMNNVIDIYDLSAVVSYFGMIDLNADGTQSDYAKYDLNRDGKIDSKDVAMVLVSWGY